MTMDGLTHLPHPLHCPQRLPARTRNACMLIVVFLHSLGLYFLLTQPQYAAFNASMSDSTSSGSIVEATIYAAVQPADAQPSAAQPPQERQPQLRDAPLKEAIRASDAFQKAAHAASNTSTSTDATGAASSALSTGASANIAFDFQGRLQAHIQPFLRYPDAIRRGYLHAIVDVIFTMDRSGIVLGVWVRQSSGYPALDQEAIATVLRSQPLPPIPSELPDPLNITLPVVFDAPS